MAVRSLTQRVEILEQKVGDLQELPTRMVAVESQILQLRDEMRVEFSAIRGQLGDIDRRMQEGREEAKRHATLLHEELITRISLIQEGVRRKKR